MAGRRNRKGKGRGRRMKRHPISKGLAGVPDVASLTEVVNQRATQGLFYSSGTTYRLYDMSLGSCPRATLVGNAYQEYRIRRITLTFKTSIDTFAGGGYAVPQLYYMIDKRGAIPSTFTLDTLTHMGAIPRRFDDKKIMIKYAPVVLQSSLTDPTLLTTAASSGQTSPWLPCNKSPLQGGAFQPSDVDHFGVAWFVYVPAGQTLITYDIDISVDFEFRKPCWTGAPAPGTTVAKNWNEYVPVVGTKDFPANTTVLVT